ncbi:MAG TPA: tetratricopeptide repeat protein [Candidatus Eisenbacteria bacterium]|nr:tetratricopeptide repeat protein [Candidatus Eisenbacteria bacterium]
MLRTRFLWAGFALVTAVLRGGVSIASERSELLVAQGEVAYNAGRREEARQRFGEALQADPNDDAARLWLDLINANVPGEEIGATRPGSTVKWWDIEAGTGVEYDSNVRLDSSDPKGDAGFLFTLAGHVDPYRDDRTLVRLDYDFFQVLHTDVTDFDVRSNRFQGTFARAVVPWLWLGTQGGYDHTVLGSHAYLQTPWVMPYASFIEGDLGSTQLTYRWSYEDYLGSPFGEPDLDRDGPSNAIGVTQLLFFFDRRLALTLGYLYFEDAPHSASGNDFARHVQQGTLGFRFPAIWRTLVELDYVYRYENYTQPNSAADFTKRRHDSGNYIALFLRRPIIEHVDGVLSYYATVNDSNISEFEYTRNIVSLELRVWF